MKSPATGYTWPTIASVLLHGSLLAFIVIGWTPQEKPRKVVTPRYVEAKLLQLNAPPTVQAKKEAKKETKAQAKPQPAPTPPPPPPPPPPKVDTAAQERKEQQRKEQEQQETVRKEQARQHQLKTEADRKLKEEQAKAEAEKKRNEEQAKSEAEKKRQEEQAKAEAEKKRQEDLKRQQAEKLRQEQLRREQELAEAMEAEQALADSAADEQQVGSYLGYVQDRIVSNWSRPPSARLGMVTELEITLDGQARVVGVAVIKSSGNPAYDLSCEQAVRRAEQFERLKELIQQDRAAYEQNFRRFRLKFDAQDLRL